MREIDVPDESQGQATQQYRPTIPQQYAPVQPQYTGMGAAGVPHQMNADEIAAFARQMNGEAEDVSQGDGLSLADMEREVSRLRAQKARGQIPLNDGARIRIEQLIGYTRLTRDVKIDENNVYVLQSLKGKEYRQAILEASAFDGTVEGPFELRKQLLARSLCSVAGIEISQFLGDASLEARLAFIEEIEDTLLNRLFDEYSELKKECVSKYGIPTAEAAKEVAEDLKK
jgi:hypothetical protein